MNTEDASRWDDVWLQYHAVNQRKVDGYFAKFDFYALPRSVKVLDIGCGSGESLKLLRSKGFRDLQGIEPEEKLIRKGAGLVRKGDILDVRSIKERYDVILVLGVLHHLHNMREIKLALRNIKSLLKPGGRFYSVEQWKNAVRTVAMKLVRDTPVGSMHRMLRLERELLRLERKELGHWLEVEEDVTAYAESIGLKMVFAEKDIRYRYIIFERV